MGIAVDIEEVRVDWSLGMWCEILVHDNVPVAGEELHNKPNHLSRLGKEQDNPKPGRELGIIPGELELDLLSTNCTWFDERSF